MLYSRLIIVILFIVSFGLAEVYTDRLRIYIDTAVSDFRIDQKTGFSNDSELNTMMSRIGATKLKQWLPMPVLRTGTAISTLIGTTPCFLKSQKVPLRNFQGNILSEQCRSC